MSKEHRKSDRRAPSGFFEVEAAGLGWLAEAEVGGGARIVRVLGHGPGWISLEKLSSARPSTAAARDFGARLAHTHDAGAPGFGVGPAGWEGDGFIGRAQLPLLDVSAAPQRWGDFYAQHRVQPYLRQARDQGKLGGADVAALERVMDRLADPADDLAGPAEPVARIHGDLWSGNVIWTDSSATLIDPAAHGGHRETDLAMLALFGLPYLGAVIDGYEQTHSLASGWQDRVSLHQLHPLLVHVVLFGGAYATQTVAAARRYA
jgi:fructosamine-3-kinase